MQRQNSLHNISRENTVHAERERELNQHHTGGCVLPQLIFSFRGLGYNGRSVYVLCLHPAKVCGGCEQVLHCEVQMDTQVVIRVDVHSSALFSTAIHLQDDFAVALRTVIFRLVSVVLGAREDR